MIETATGLVLRTYPLTESSLIVHWLTAAAGRIATVAKGARRPKSPFHGKLDLFYLADFSFNRSRRSELHTLREVKLRETHSALRRELGYLQQASYCAALVDGTTEIETPLPEIFELLRGMLGCLSLAEPQNETIFAFELKLLNQMGLEPDFSETRLALGTQQSAQDLLRLDWPAVMRFRLEAAESAELRHFLYGFLVYHLGRVPKGREAALTRISNRDRLNP
jgi:DNA repair protein RecO (recombination protein O)